jgi:hypothetical protein
MQPREAAARASFSETEVYEATRRAAVLEAEVRALRDSTSWRATAAMRAVVDYIKRLF